VGGPSSASRKWATTNVIARFLPFLLPSPATNTCYTQAATTTSLASKCEPEVVLFVVSTQLPPLPPPSCPNASWRWLFLSFQHDCHHHHLPHIQMRAGGGHFCRFDTTPTTTSLASKCELEVVIFIILTRLPPPPPPSHPNASRRWSFSSFRHDSHHHLPRIQMRAGGGYFHRFDTTATTTTSLASKHEPEVVFFSMFRHVSHHNHLPHIQMRAGGGSFRCFDMSPATTTTLTSKREPEVVLFGGFKASATTATSSLPAN